MKLKTRIKNLVMAIDTLIQAEKKYLGLNGDNKEPKITTCPYCDIKLKGRQSHNTQGLRLHIVGSHPEKIAEYFTPKTA